MSKLTLSFKSKVLKVFPVLQGTMVIGSDPNCTILIDNLAVQPRHAQIETANENSMIRDLGSEEGIYIGQSKIEGLQEIKDGDVLRIGKHTITYSFSKDITSENDKIAEASAVEAPIQMETQEKTQGWLQIMNGSNLGKTISLNRAMTNLGKPGISSAVITKRHDGYFISQLEGGDTHPLLIKNQKLGGKSQLLIDSDTIQIGNIKMQFYIE